MLAYFKFILQTLELNCLNLSTCKHADTVVLFLKDGNA